MKVEYWDVDVVEELSVVFYGVATREENNDLLLHVLFEESEEEEEVEVLECEVCVEVSS